MDERFSFELVTPDRLMLSTYVNMVVVPGGEGDFGVLPGHAPLISTVRPGTVNIYKDNKISGRFFVAGGFAEVSEERCTVLAEEAVPINEIVREDVLGRIDRARTKLEAGKTLEERRAHGHVLDAAEAMLAALDELEKERT